MYVFSSNGCGRHAFFKRIVYKFQEQKNGITLKYIYEAGYKIELLKVDGYDKKRTMTKEKKIKY